MWFSVLPNNSYFGYMGDGLLPNTILTAFGCYYQFQPDGDASLTFRWARVPGVQHGENMRPCVFYLHCREDLTGHIKTVLVDTGAINNHAGPEVMAGANVANVTLFQTSNHQLCLEQVRQKPLGQEIHMIAGTKFMSKYVARHQRANKREAEFNFLYGVLSSLMYLQPTQFY